MRARVALSALLLTVVALLTLGPAPRLAGGCPAAQAGAWSLERGEYDSEVQASLLSTSSSSLNCAGT